MGINKEKNIEANLQIGPTDRGMVRIFVVPKILKYQWILKLMKQMKLLKKSVLLQKPPH